MKQVAVRVHMLSMAFDLCVVRWIRALPGLHSHCGRRRLKCGDNDVRHILLLCKAVVRASHGTVCVRYGMLLRWQLR